MFSFDLAIVYRKKEQKSVYKIGTKFVKNNKEFFKTLEIEFKKILRYKREKSIKGTEEMNFREVSEEYLNLLLFSHIINFPKIHKTY